MHRFFASCLVLPVLAACGSKAAQAAEDPLKTPLGLEKAPPLVVAADNPLTAAKVELGKQLFFDPRLSGTGKMSCSSCHLPELAFTDGQPLSTKDDGKANTRNSPTMHNVGYLDRLYWDGRAKTLELNVEAAWKSQIGGKPDAAAAAIAAVPAYQKAFTEAFNAPATPDTIVKALASFLRNLRSGDSEFDRWQAGKENKVSDAAKAGYELFTTKAGCILCHTPPLFTDKIFHNVGIGMKAENPDIGAAGEKAFNDPSKKGQFKTPTLRDVAKTGPYLHDGSAKTLAEVVKIMSSGGIDNPNKDLQMVNRGVTDEEQAQIVAFLETLTGNVPWQAPVVPK
ncbi:MAG TPA: cytochrome c peroxidase [Planctomycetota bacterium]|nr:cytochrome c peroxidase [Planctomycetota bacterium]